MKQWVTMGVNEVHWGKPRVATVIAGQAPDSLRISVEFASTISAS